MYIDIVNSRDPLFIYNALKKMHKCEIEFTPDVLVNFLKCTNHPTSIRDLLKEFDNISENKIYNFKDAICSMVERREHRNDNVEKIKELALKGGFVDELLEADKKIKYQKQTFIPVKIYEADDNEVYDDISSYDVLVAKNCGTLQFNKLPKILDFSENTSSTLYFSGFTTNPVQSDLEDTIFIPPEREIPFICMHCIRSLPKELDFSRCRKILITFCNLSKTNIKFMEGASVTINHVYGVPKELDFSKCKYVDLSNSSLYGCEKIKFGKDSTVILDDAEDLPTDLDFSMCGNVSLVDTHLNDVKRITFKNKMQKTVILNQKFLNYENPEIIYKSDGQNIFSKIFCNSK